MPSSDLVAIVGPALAAGLMLALVHAPLGMEVLRRGIIFVDLAVAQIAGLGLVGAAIWLHEPSPWAMQAVALACALAAGLIFQRIERALPRVQEALIGVSFVLAASLAILLLANHVRGDEAMRHLLSGEMLFVTWGDVARHAPIYALITAAWFAAPALRRGIGFYVLFALAVTSSVQLAGVYVVFASLILPALAAVEARRPYRTAWLCGICAVPSGIAAAVLADAPAGPMLVVSYTLVAGCFALFFALWQAFRREG